MQVVARNVEPAPERLDALGNFAIRRTGDEIDVAAKMLPQRGDQTRCEYQVANPVVLDDETARHDRPTAVEGAADFRTTSSKL